MRGDVSGPAVSSLRAMRMLSNRFHPPVSSSVSSPLYHRCSGLMKALPRYTRPAAERVAIVLPESGFQNTLFDSRCLAVLSRTAAVCLSTLWDLIITEGQWDAPQSLTLNVLCAAGSINASLEERRPCVTGPVAGLTCAHTRLQRACVSLGNTPFHR